MSCIIRYTCLKQLFLDNNIAMWGSVCKKHLWRHSVSRNSLMSSYHMLRHIVLGYFDIWRRTRVNVAGILHVETKSDLAVYFTHCHRRRQGQLSLNINVPCCCCSKCSLTHAASCLCIMLKTVYFSLSDLNAYIPLIYFKRCREEAFLIKYHMDIYLFNIPWVRAC